MVSCLPPRKGGHTHTQQNKQTNKKRKELGSKKDLGPSAASPRHVSETEFFHCCLDPKRWMCLSRFKRRYHLMKWVSLLLPLRWDISIIKSITESLPRNNWVYYSMTCGLVSALKTGSSVINQNLTLLIPITNNVWSLKMANRRADTNLVPWVFINWTFVTLDLLEIRAT